MPTFQEWLLSPLNPSIFLYGDRQGEDNSTFLLMLMKMKGKHNSDQCNKTNLKQKLIYLMAIMDDHLFLKKNLMIYPVSSHFMMRKRVEDNSLRHLTVNLI